MNKWISLWAICLCAGFLSCSDDEKEDGALKVYVPETYVTNFLNLDDVKKWQKTEQVELKIGQTGLLKIEGGNRQYDMARADDEAMAEILPHPHDADVVTISANTLGTTTIRIQGADQQVTTIPLTISEEIQYYMFCNSHYDILIKTGNEEPDEPLRKAIAEKVEERYLFRAEMMELTYDTPTSGKFLINNRKDAEALSGTFQTRKDDQINGIHLTLSTQEQSYHYTVAKNISSHTRSLPPETTYFVEDLTELLQTDHPTLTQVLVITKVCV